MKAVKIQATIDKERRLVIDVPAGFAEGPVELILLGEEAGATPSDVNLAEHLKFIMSLPGNRSQADIDAELEAERDSWG